MEATRVSPLPIRERERVRVNRNTEKCRRLRKNQTDAEKKLWSVLRNRRLSGTKFKRQFPVGKYILDFYSPEHKLGIEADGGQHYGTEGMERDRLRTGALSKHSIKILRFSDIDILNNIESVCEAILRVIGNRKVGPSP